MRREKNEKKKLEDEELIKKGYLQLRIVHGVEL